MIALILEGMYREFDSTYKLIKDTIPQNTDIYFSTWNNSYDIYDDGVNKLEVKDNIEISPTMIEEIEKFDYNTDFNQYKQLLMAN